MRIKTPNNSNIASYLKPNTEYKVLKTYDDGSFDFDLISHGMNINGYSAIKNSAHLHQQDWIIISDMPNREFLAEFIKMNKIKKTVVSEYLGYSTNWLTTMVNEKRRGDLSDKTLQAILKKLHIDWSSNEFIQVKKTKEHTAYRTRPSTYKRDVDKVYLQNAMWQGEFVV